MLGKLELKIATVVTGHRSAGKIETKDRRALTKKLLVPSKDTIFCILICEKHNNIIEKLLYVEFFLY